MRVVALFLIVCFAFYCTEKGKDQPSQQENILKHEYLEKGAKITTLTQTELLKNVSKAMQEGGPGYAVEFCNLRALYLKDSLSQVYNCQIQRIASKYRNPLDMPQTDNEKQQLEHYQQAFQQGDTLKPAVYLFDDHVEYYQPIMLAKEACLKCHGQPGKEIAEETLEKIRQRYPMDLATGFALNDFRGAWKVTFKK